MIVVYLLSTDSIKIKNKKQFLIKKIFLFVKVERRHEGGQNEEEETAGRHHARTRRFEGSRSREAK